MSGSFALGTCGAPTSEGHPCAVTGGLCPEPACGRCLFHCEHRHAQARAARARGRHRRYAPRGRGGAVAKTVTAGELPVSGAPETIDDALKLSAWASVAVLTGTIDAKTGDVAGKLLSTFKAVLKERDVVREVEHLRAQLAELRRPSRA